MSGERDKTPEKRTDGRTMLAIRTLIFGVCVFVLAAISGYFVFGVITEHSEVGLSASGFYTIRLAPVPEETRSRIEELLDDDDFRSRFSELVGMDAGELFINDAGEGRIALCAGRFDSAGSREARQLLSRVRAYEHAGRRPFQGAEIRFINAGEQ